MKALIKIQINNKTNLMKTCCNYLKFVMRTVHILEAVTEKVPVGF